LDGSDNVSRHEFYYQMEFVHNLVGKFQLSRRSVRFSLISYGSGTTTHVQFHNHQRITPLQRAISRIVQRKGSLHTHLALRRMREEFARQNNDREKVAVVISSGSSTNPTATREEATLAKSEGIKLYAIGFGTENPDLTAIASEPLEDYKFTLPGYTSLSAFKTLLVLKVCEEIKVEPTTTTSTTTTAPTTASRGFVPKAEMMLGDQAVACDNTPVDVVFSLPSDLGTTDTAHVLNFIRSLTYSLNISQNSVNIGLVPKDCYSTPGFELSAGHNAFSLREKLDVNHFKKTNMASEIRRIRQQSFQAANGGRSNAKRIAVIVMNKPSYDVVEMEYEAENAKMADGIEMFVIAVGDGVPDLELNTISSYPTSTHVLRVDEFCDLLALNLQLAERLCP